MHSSKAKRATVAGRIYRYNLALVFASVLLSGSLCLYFALTIRQNDYDRLIRDVAKAVSETQEVREALQAGIGPGTPETDLTADLDLVFWSFENIDLLVVCDTESIRYYHNEHEKIGQRFQGDDQAAILNGAEPYISEALGTLGMQRRAFSPVTDGSGRRIGFVMCSILTEHLTRIRIQITAMYLGTLILLMGAGVLLSGAVMRRIRRILLGYQPEEFRDLYIERAEVIDTLEEGIVAVNQENKIILINQAARTLFQISGEQVVEGVPLDEFFPETRLYETLQTGEARYHTNQRIQNQTVLSTYIPIFRGDQLVGATAVLWDKTEMEKLAEELTGARYMVDTLRAFNHEFTNKLHIILGFLETKDMEKAKEYILKTSLVSGEAVSGISRTVPISNLAALLIGKLIRASELGIQFSLKSDSFFQPKKSALPVDCFITLVGNLIENAFEELNRQDFPVKQVELGLYSEPGHTLITCDDTGGGIPEHILDSIYERHTTTKGDGHGTGFARIQEIVDCYGGSVHIDTELGAGTSIEITLPI